ncbi:MAG: superoxide dismutase [Micavibrio aeruginosavorus]|uniref:Superoxide dismutase n=1 Tax=Micavibrio aeruginosavorus TaxID=349221 RepID=A0A2W5Q777_9BACT|nr:MAG: superoxide dismutase [Micavibrio aeruginosavorus]
MEKAITKRAFLGYLGALPVGLAALKYIKGDLISPAYATADAPPPAGPFTLPDLPYAKTALEKAIDAQTMTLHHDKHHQAYVDNLNKEVAKDKNLQGKTIEEIIANISKYSPATRNNGGGHWNHSFFWTIMTPEKTAPSTELDADITKTFGSIEEFKKKFEEAGTKQFGSGWVWLIVNKSGKLEIASTPNQDNPLMNDAKVKGAPILGNDVWEHAYYLRYFNKRADYLKSWWQVVNWERVSELYAQAKA